MFKWKKLGRLFTPADLPGDSWMKEYAQSPSAVVFDDFVRVYFCTRPAPSADGQYMSYLAYLDVARDDPTRVLRVGDAPAMPLGGFGAFDEFGSNPVSVIRNGDEMRVYYAGWTRCESVPFNAAIGMAVSRDGGHSFERIGAGPVLSYSPDEPYLLGSPRIRKFGDTWSLWYVAGKAWLKTALRPEPVYRLRMATSQNGVDWVKHGQDLLPAKLGDEECQACADIIEQGGRFHMFYSYRQAQNYKTGDGGYRIGYAWSADLLTWTRDDDAAGMSVSAEGWDAEMVCYPHVFELDGSFYMLYQGNQMGRTGVGLALLENPQRWSQR
jgi:predicted GH43/DUF377 family glycosyl hydrolase